MKRLLFWTMVAVACGAGILFWHGQGVWFLLIVPLCLAGYRSGYLLGELLDKKRPPRRHHDPPQYRKSGPFSMN